MLITRPEESYRLWCVVVCDLETSRICAPYIYIYIYDISSLRVKRLAVKTCRCGTIHFYPQPYTEPSASSSGHFTFGERVSSTHSLGCWKGSKPVKM